MSKEEIKVKVKDLMSKMTAEEKVAQLACIMPSDLNNPEELGIENGIGAIPILGGMPDQTAEQIQKIQTYVLEHSPNKIPVLFHCESLTGPLLPGTNQYPLSISLGATFEPEIVEEMAEINSKQMRSVGLRHALSPVVDVVRDQHWGRIGECYGGDPVLCGAMGTAYVKGMQKDDEGLSNAATLKHFLGYSATMGGLNMAQTVVTPRDLREVFARPFEMAIRNANVKGIMNSYSEYNGKPVCASKELLTDLLRDDLGFDGIVVSDYSSVDRLRSVFKTTEDITEAGKMCLEAGLDMEFPSRLGYGKEMAEQAENGEYDMTYIDRAVERVLTLKYELGLFDNPFPQYDKMAAALDNTENNRKSLEAAKKTMTLTKNEGILPITDKSKKIAVIGPMANTLRAFFGCYTIAGGTEMSFTGQNAMAGVGDNGGSAEDVTSGFDIPKLDMHIADQIYGMMYPDARTTYAALSDKFENITFTEGCDYRGSEKNDFKAAKRAAAEADIVIMTLGGRNGWGTYCTSGEGIDSLDIGLPGDQDALLHAVYEANPNIVLVHTDCRALVNEWAYENIPAILEAWLPCAYGGIAIVETLVGENNPGGRLQMDVPRTSMQAVVGHYFNRGTDYESFKKGAINKLGYVDGSMKARLPFGYGLSYTEFDYSDFDVTMDENGYVKVSIKVTNIGDTAGDEVVQLYGVDPVASIIRPAEELIGFKRISLEPGETKTVVFTLNVDILAFYDEPGHWMVEAGDFEFYVGKNAKERIASEIVKVAETYEIDHKSRCLIAEVSIR